ncbi:MAG: heme lyase CcmF/NrfE family subunit [Myxococcaceae bacterium]|nr:heme lyase CcmF/NrfE family subunit [Myxococcaceae bacterium]
MNSTLGYGLVLAGLAFAAFAAVVGLVTGLTRRENALPWVQRAIYGFAASMILSNVVMVKALLEHDFSVKYVSLVGSKATPTIFTIVSLWSALEGSILFWGAIMGGYLIAFTWTYRNEHGRYMQLSLGVMAAVATFFAFLIAGPANPWGHIPNPASDGPGPNPLLQNHALMIIHPPMLYLGYVGMTVPFGIAAGALLRGELGDAWLVPLRKWTLVPWLFLSIGIILGSWWAYAVLGWGGYWAWDPVENASFMPWLTATAFMHSTMVLERKKSLKLWTIALALGSFVLTIIGTFMTRSGVFNSVHAFTQSDIGPTFLIFIAIVLVFSVLLLTVRGHLLIAESHLETVWSREGSILVNNLVFVALTFTVLLGTLFPLVTEALQDKKISVGEPYFNTMALPLGLLTLFLMGVGPMLPWGKADPKVLKQQAYIPGGLGLATLVPVFFWRYAVWEPFGTTTKSLGAFLAHMTSGDWMALATFGVAVFVTVVTLREMFLPAQQRMVETKESLFTALVVSASRARRRFGGYVVHLGIVAIIVAIAASSAYKVAAERTVKVGDSLKVGQYTIRFDGLANGREPHRDWVAANLTVIGADGSEYKHVGADAPRMNYYERSNDPIGSPLVQEMVWRDIYVSLRTYDPKAQTATFNAWVFPLVGWIWYAIPLLVLGTLIALWPQRKTIAVVKADAPAAAAAPGTP